MYPSTFRTALDAWEVFWYLEDSRHGNLPHMTVNSERDVGAGRWLGRQGHRYYTSTGIAPPLRLNSLDSSLHSSWLEKIEWNDRILIRIVQKCNLYQWIFGERTAKIIGSPADGYTLLWAGLSICSNDVTETRAIAHRWTRTGCLHTHLHIWLCIHLRPHTKVLKK